jgi:hypothetical protein
VTEQELWWKAVNLLPREMREFIKTLVSGYIGAFGQEFPLPITTAEAGCVTFEWNSPTDYLQVEIKADILEWFFRDTANRRTETGRGVTFFYLLRRFDTGA